MFDTYYADPLSANVMTAIAQNLKDNIGITVKPTALENVAWQKNYYEDGTFQISFWGAANGPTGDRAFNYLHSSTAYPGGSNGWKGHPTRTRRSTRSSRTRARNSTRPSRTRCTSRPARSFTTICRCSTCGSRSGSTS